MCGLAYSVADQEVGILDAAQDGSSSHAFAACNSKFSTLESGDFALRAIVRRE